MPVKVISRETTNALSSGSVTSLSGNVMDWAETTIRFEVGVYFRTGADYTIQINTDDSVTLYGGNWADFGFEIGDDVTLIVNVTDATNLASADYNLSTGSVIVSDIQGDTMTFVAPIAPALNVAATVPGQDALYVYNYVEFSIDKDFEGIEFKYNQMLNSDYNSPTLNSVLDASETTFRLGGLDVLNTSYTAMTPTAPKSGNSVYSAEIKGVSKSGVYSTFDVKVIHSIVGLYDELSDIQLEQQPEWFIGSESPTDTYKAKFYRTYNDENLTLSSDLDATVAKKLGNVGWFNEDKNGLPNNYTISNVAFANASADPVSGIQSSGETTITFTVTDANSGFDSSTSTFLWGCAFVPTNRSDFQNNNYTNLENLTANTMGVNQSYSHSASPTVATIDGFTNPQGAQIDVTSYQFEVVGADELEVTIIVEPNSSFVDFLDTLTLSDRQMCFWVSVGTVASMTATDRVSLLYPCLAIDEAVSLDPYTFDSVDEFPYDLNYYNGDDSYISNFISTPLLPEDDFHINYNFSIEDDATIDSVTFGIDIADSSANRLYVADSFTENLSNQPIDSNGTQQINVESNRLFKYLPDFKDNFISLKRDSANDSAPNRAYNFTTPYRIRWEWWKENNVIPSLFFLVTEPNNNLNYEWFTKQMSGAKIRYFIDLTITDKDGVTTDYRNVYNTNLDTYETDSKIANTEIQVFPDDTFTTDSEIGTKTNQYEGKEYAIIDNQDNFIQATFTDLVNDISNNKYCEVTIEVEDGAGWLSMWKIRSDQTPESNNPLQPLTGETALKVTTTTNTVIAQCKLDPTLLQNINYKISAEWINYRVSGDSEGMYTYAWRNLSWAKILRLAEPDPTEERTFGTCGYKIPVLASTTSTELYKNDILGLLYKRADASFDIELYLIDSDGNEYALNDNTYGTYFPFGSFTYEENVIAYQVAWRQVLSELGEGCYSFKRVNTEFGVETTFYSCCYDLKEFSVANAENTVRVETVQNGLIEELDINYKGLNWASHLRFEGSFGYQEPNYEQDIIIDTNNNQQVNRQDLTSEYLLKSKLVPHKCITKQLWEWYLRGTELFISDYNSDNHSYDYKSFAVLLLNPETPKYIQRNRNAVIQVRFKERVLKHRLTTVDGDRPSSYLSPDYVYENQCPISDAIKADLSFIGTADQCNVIFSAGGVTTFTTVESSTNIGTLTISTDDVTFSAFSLPWTPTAATPYYFKRTGTGDGNYIITD